MQSKGIGQGFISSRIGRRTILCRTGLCRTSLYRTLLAGVVLFFTSGLWVSAQTPADTGPDSPYRTQRSEPFRIIGNIYYVGDTLHLTTYLITTPEGHILIDTGYEESVPGIRENIEKLGFQVKDVKLMISSHAHHDHIGGHALMKEVTGATVLATAADAEVIETGGKADFRDTGLWKPAKVDRTIQDGEPVTLGGITLMPHLTPGHTKGCTTWTMEVEEGGRKYNVVFVCGVRVNTGLPLVGNPKYPNSVEDFTRSFETLKSLPCDVFLGAHGYWFGVQEKLKRREQGAGVNPFIDPEGYRAYIANYERAFLDQLSAERGTP